MVFVAGNVLTAAELNALGTWSAWTPTVTASSGTFTSVSGAGRYAQIGKTIDWSLTITITTVGTASGTLLFTLPVTASVSGNRHIGGGAAGVALVSYLNSATQGAALKYDGTSPISATSLHLSGSYEAA